MIQGQKELLSQNQWWFLSRHLSGNPIALNTAGPGALTLPASPATLPCVCSHICVDLCGSNPCCSKVSSDSLDAAI